jgi:hypothetical protein
MVKMKMDECGDFLFSQLICCMTFAMRMVVMLISGDLKSSCKDSEAIENRYHQRGRIRR